MQLELNNISLAEDLETVIEALNRLHDGLHYWQFAGDYARGKGALGVQELRAKLTDASLKAFLIQEKL